ncbi:MAG: hypothetical protein JWN17_87, partial [Frankiales bacterium]|nr:hypothetical protein [Frankiales bacterium]
VPSVLPSSTTTTSTSHGYGTASTRSRAAVTVSASSYTGTRTDSFTGTTLAERGRPDGGRLVGTLLPWRDGARAGVYGACMSEPSSSTPSDGPPLVPVSADPDALPRPEEEVADAGTPSDDAPLDPQDQPAAGGTADGPAAQGDGAADSY